MPLPPTDSGEESQDSDIELITPGPTLSRNGSSTSHLPPLPPLDNLRASTGRIQIHHHSQEAYLHATSDEPLPPPLLRTLPPTSSASLPPSLSHSTSNQTVRGPSMSLSQTSNVIEIDSDDSDAEGASGLSAFIRPGQQIPEQRRTVSDTALLRSTANGSTSRHPQLAPSTVVARRRSRQEDSDEDEDDELPDILGVRSMSRSMSGESSNAGRSHFRASTTSALPSTSTNGMARHSNGPSLKGKERAVSTYELDSSPPPPPLRASAQSTSSTTGKGKGRATTTPIPSGQDSDDEPAKKKRKRVADEEKARLQREKEAEKARKAQEKFDKTASAAAAKEAKKAITDSNKLSDRRKTCAELKLEISSPLLADETFYKKVYPSLHGSLDELDCLHSQKDAGRPPAEHGWQNTIHWKRQVTKDYDERAKYWRPREPSEYATQEEHTVLLYFTAFDVEDAIEASRVHDYPNSLVGFVDAARNLYGSDYQVFILVQNLSEKAKAKHSAENAEFQAQVRGANSTPNQDASARRIQRRNGLFNKKITMPEIEKELVKVSIAQRCFVIRAEKYDETVDWLVELTKDISFRPYKLIERANETILNIDGKIESTEGGDLRVTFINQLSSIHGVTRAMATAIVQEYPTWRKLITAYARCGTQKEKDQMLANLAVGSNVTGAATGRVIGKAISEKVHIVLFSTNKDQSLSGNIATVRSRG